MSKSAFVGLVLAFIFLFTTVLDLTIDRAYPVPSYPQYPAYTSPDQQENNGLSDYELKYQEQTAAVASRNNVLFVGYLVLGFILVLLGLKSLHEPLPSNMLLWPGLWLVSTSATLLKSSSFLSGYLSLIGGGMGSAALAPVWTLIVAWVSLIALFFIGYGFRDDICA